MASAQAISDQAEKQLRSVFVGNIPYETNEEELRNIFSRVGPVVNFRIVIDRDTNKPKGYGFCEYLDLETAQSAIRNLNGLGLYNRVLRVDSAMNERGKEDKNETKQIEIPQPGPIVLDELPTENIVKLLSSMGTDQLTELLQQSKQSLIDNPDETRELLRMNPQLSYALMQSLVLLKAIDSKILNEALIRQSRINPFSNQEMRPPEEYIQSLPPPPNYSSEAPIPPRGNQQYFYESKRPTPYISNDIPPRKHYRNDPTYQDPYIIEHDNKRAVPYHTSPKDKLEITESSSRHVNYGSNNIPPTSSHVDYKYKERSNIKYSHESGNYGKEIKPSYKVHNDPRIDYRNDIPPQIPSSQVRENRHYDKDLKNIDPRHNQKHSYYNKHDDYIEERQDYSNNPEYSSNSYDFRNYRQNRYK